LVLNAFPADFFGHLALGKLKHLELIEVLTLRECSQVVALNVFVISNVAVFILLVRGHLFGAKNALPGILQIGEFVLGFRLLLQKSFQLLKLGLV
jgi:hypothetical protein